MCCWFTAVTKGIRLKPAGCQEEWDLASLNQWGEACLMLHKDAPFKA